MQVEELELPMSSNIISPTIQPYLQCHSILDYRTDRGPGLIITLSLLCAAGIAIYENPHVKEWFDDSRRRVEMAFRELGHELNGTSERPATRCPRDASTQEDDTPEAVERRRLARQEILERGRRLEERRRSREAANKPKSASFDDLVDKDGSLKPEASTTAAEPIEQASESGLRHRHTEAKAAALGATMANPFSDETYILHEPEDEESGARTPTLPAPSIASPPLPPKPAAYQPQALFINTTQSKPANENETETISNHPSEDPLLNLTPTTSAAPSSFADDLASLTPNSTHPNGQPAAASSPSSPSPSQQQSYWSVNEWAQQHSGPAAFYSPPPQSEAGAALPAGELERAMSEMMMSDSERGSLAGDDGERVSQMGSVAGGWDSDADDDGPGISTPGSWTDVGSTVSEEL